MFALPRIVPLAEHAVTLEFSAAFAAAAHRRILVAARLLDEHPFPGYREAVPAYATLTVYFDPFAVIRQTQLPGATVADRAGRYICEQILPLITEGAEEARRVVEIPVCYGGQFGPDLVVLAEYCQLTPDEVIERHARPIYDVVMLGFAPGFPYLSGLDERLHAPRLAAPRLRVPAGSVGIGGAQTGVYPLATAGGWQLLGRTPLALFAPSRVEPCLLRPGDHVRFVPITAGEFAAAAGDA